MLVTADQLLLTRLKNLCEKALAKACKTLLAVALYQIVHITSVSFIAAVLRCHSDTEECCGILGVC